MTCRNKAGSKIVARTDQSFGKWQLMKEKSHLLVNNICSVSFVRLGYMKAHEFSVHEEKNS